MFREKLGTASGFQSFQMREMELLLGLEFIKKLVNLLFFQQDKLYQV